MADKLWKRHERSVAKALGGERVPVSGRGDGPDVSHPRLSVECKQRRQLPGWLTKAMGQAEVAAKPGQLPVAVLHQSGERHDRDLCVIRLAVLKRIARQLSLDILY